MPLRGWIKRFEHEARVEMVEIPQRDGTVARFPQSELATAYINIMERLGAGSEADAPAEHPLLVAVRNYSDLEWRNSFYAEDPDEWSKPVGDLSES